MLSFLSKLRRDKRGNVLILMGAAMPLLVASAGLATDTIQWALWKRQIQRAADSAAIAGVYERMRASGGTSGVPDAVTKDLEYNQQTGMDLHNSIPTTCSTGTTTALGCPADVGTDRRHQVQVTLEVQKPLTFSAMFMSGAPVIRATSTAASVPGGDEYCVIGLDRRADKTAITIGGSTTVNMGNCSAMSNSSHPSAAATNVGESANGIFVAKSLAAVGGVAYSRRWTVESYDPGTPAVQDPYGPDSGRELTIPSTCTGTTTIANGADRRTTDAPVNGVRKTICVTGGISVNGNNTTQLGSATYVLNGGDLSMSSANSAITCNGCTIILTHPTTPASVGNIQITGGTLSLIPPTTGPYRGIAIYQDRRATDNNSNSPQNRINGNASSNVQGVVYTPGRSLSMLGGGSLTAPVCLQVIGKRVTFTGNSYIKLSSLCGGYGMDPIAAGRLVRLVA
jgi:Flp pilus assembly protein TadG